MLRSRLKRKKIKEKKGNHNETRSERKLKKRWNGKRRGNGEIVAKALDSQRYPSPCLKRLCLKVREGAGQ